MYPAPKQSAHTPHAWSYSVKNDEVERLVLDRKALVLKHALLRPESALMSSCRVVGISIADVYEHAFL